MPSESNENQHDEPIDSGMPAPVPSFKRIAPWMQWPILFYLIIVIVFAILAAVVFYFVITRIPAG